MKSSVSAEEFATLKEAYNNKLKDFLSDFDISDYKQSIDFYNILMTNMYKIDIHEQIMMNIDVINDILSEEFNIN